MAVPSEPPAEVWASRLAAVESPAAFVVLLRRLREDSGRSVQAVAARGKIAGGTVQNLCSARAGAPKWSSVDGFLAGCGVADRELRGLWRQAYDRAYPPRGGPPNGARPPGGDPAARAHLDERLAELVAAQWEDAHSHPYQFFAGHPPTLPKLYVAQRGEPSGLDRADEAGGASETAELFTAREMLERSRNVLVVSAPGMGKSTLVNQIQYQQAGWWLAEHGPDNAPAPFGTVLPIAVPAGLLVERSLAEALNEVCDRLRCGRVFSAGTVAAPAPGHSWLIMVDGLDEVLTSYDRSRVLDKVVSWIQREQDQLRFLVASRPLAVGDLAELRALRIGEYRLRRFDDADLRAFAGNWFGARDTGSGFLARVSAARLRSVVRVPLLATIAALVFAADPERELPTSRAGLYARFVEHLRDGRRDAPEHRRRVEAEFGRYGPAGRRAGDWLQRVLPELLEHLAETQVASTRPALLALARRWVIRGAADADVALVAGWEGHLRSLLTGTALLVERGPDLVFAHQSFAEYLAAGPRARQFDETAWLADVRSPERRNLALFVLALSVETADRLVRMLLDNGGADVVAAGDVLADGIEVDVPLYRRVVDALLAQVTAEDPTALDALRVLTDLRSDPAVAVRLDTLVRDGNAGPWVRAVLADALDETGEHDDHVRLLMAEPALPGETLRWLALRCLRRPGRAADAAADAERLLIAHPLGSGADGGTAGVFRRYAIREVSADATVSPQDRLTAALELVRIGDATAVITLRACVVDGDLRLDLRLEAARAWLAADGDARDTLLGFAASAGADRDVRVVASVALAEAGHPDGRRVLAGLVAEQPALLTRLPAIRTALEHHRPVSALNMSDVAPVAAPNPPYRSSSEARRIWGGVPPRNPHFTGRPTLLDQLREGHESTLTQAICGVGGVGKTQLAIEYVHRQRDNYDLVWWIPAEQTSHILSSLTELARRLDLDVSPEANTAVPAVREVLSTGQMPYRNWLLIFDNADDPAMVRPFIPVGGSGRVLVTSRNQGWLDVGAGVEVDVFDREESIAFLQRRGSDLSSPDADRLAEALGDLPLAVEQAVAWHAVTGMPAAAYLAALAGARAEPSARLGGIGYESTVTAAFEVALDQLGEVNPAALQLLQICACLAPEPVPRALLAGVAASPITPELDAVRADPIRLSRAFRDLQRYALAHIDHGRDAVDAHRIVTAVVRARMTDDERTTMRRGAHTLLADADPHEPTDPSAWERYQMLVPHVLASGAAQSADPRVRELVFGVAQFLYHWGDHLGSETLATEAYRWQTAQCGESDPATLRMTKWLAWTYLVNGRFADARHLNSRALELYRATVGDHDRGTIDAMRMVAIDLRVSGDFAAARRLDERAVDAATDLLGADDPQTLVCAGGLATSMRMLGEFEQAAALDEDTLRRQEAALGSNHGATVLTHNNLNHDIRALGRYAEAHRRQEELHRRCLVAFGEHFAPTLRAARLLAVARRLVGDRTGARALSGHTLMRLRRRYGDDQPYTIIAALGHAFDLRLAGQLDAARALHDETLARFNALYGDQHLYTHAARTGLAVTIRHLGDLTAARALNEAALDGLTDLLGPDHPATLSCATNLANDRFAQGDPDHAHELDADTVERSQRILGPHHPATLTARANLALDLAALAHTNDSTRLLTALHHRLTHLLGPQHPTLQDLQNHHRTDADIDPPDV